MENNGRSTVSHILYLITLKKYNSPEGIKGVAIARELKLTKTSVHNMMKLFVSERYIEKEPGGRAFLTEHGLERASYYEQRLNRIKQMLFADGEIDIETTRAICAFLAELSEDKLEKLG